ncbi:hypothetical protein B6V00_03700 [ANME-1 cluster archaeon ex4572_4]|nr:MAG: hypothetical protein B6V00_03700 [ANME-1 cluster archaeon ex4572_4]
MKETMSNVDVAVVVAELQDLLGARLVKAYQPGRDEIRLRLHHKERGSLDLIVEAGRRIHLTKYKRPSPRMPSGFAMFLRKHLGGGRISKIRQLDFDRIVEISVERCEFELAELFKEAKNGKKEVVKVLASELSLGGLYAEEVCRRAGVEKGNYAGELAESEITAVRAALSGLFEPVLTSGKSKLKAPHTVVEKRGEEKLKLDFLPFELSVYKDKEKVFFGSFNDAADEFFTTQIAKEQEEKAKGAREEAVGKHERILKEQEAALRKFKVKEEESVKKGELIYARYNEIENILREIGKNKKRKTVKLTLPNTSLQLEIDTSVSLHKNASAYYEKAKVFRKKRAGVQRALAEMKKRLKAETEKAKEKEQARTRAERTRAEKGEEGAEWVPRKKEVRRKEEWYEKFRWFETSDGFLVLAGKDATTNEILVKKHLQPNDLFFHTQAEGAPVAVVKTGGKEISEAGLREAAQFAASYSNLWKYGFYEGECYCVSGEQVSKTPPSGEYIKKGSFVVRGKRRYFKAALGLCVGLEKEKEKVRGRLVACPSTDSQREKLEKFVELEPGSGSGDLEKNELSMEIVRFFAERAEVKVAQEKVLSLLPPGRSRVKRK